MRQRGGESLRFAAHPTQCLLKKLNEYGGDAEQAAFWESFLLRSH
jgi:hypothetical protein